MFSLRGRSLRGRLLTSRRSHYRARSVFRDAHTESVRVSNTKRLLWVFTAGYVARGIFIRPLEPYHIWACVWGPPGIHMLIMLILNAHLKARLTTAIRTLSGLVSAVL